MQRVVCGGVHQPPVLGDAQCGGSGGHETIPLKVHKREKFFGSDFELFTIL